MKRKNNVKAVILAAGKGVRMKSKTAKVLHRILGKPILLYVVDAIRFAGIDEIIVVIGYQGEEVKKVIFGKDVTYIVQKEQKGTGDALKQCKSALRNFRGNIFVIGGDTPLITSHTISAVMNTATESGASCVILTGDLDNPTGYGRIIRTKDGEVKRIVEELDATGPEKQIKEVNSGIYSFRSPEIFSVLDKIKPNNKKGEYYLTDAIEILLSKKRRVLAVNTKNAMEIVGVNTKADLVIVSNYIRQKRHISNKKIEYEI